MTGSPLRLGLLPLLGALAACGNDYTAPCTSPAGEISGGLLTRLDCRAHFVSVAGPRSQLAAIASLPAGSAVLVVRDPDYLVLLTSDTTRAIPLLLPDSVDHERPIGVAVTDDTLASVLFYPLGDIAAYSLPRLSQLSVSRSVPRASSLAPWRGGHVVTHAARDSGIVVSTAALGLDSPSPALFAERFRTAPRAANLFGRGLIAAGDSGLAVISDVADVAVLLSRNLRVRDSVTFVIRLRDGAPRDVAATIARLDAAGPALSRIGASSPAVLAFGEAGSLRVVFEDLELEAGAWGSQAYISSARPRGGTACADVPIEGPSFPRRRFAFRGDTLFIAWLDPHQETRVVLERRLFDASRCAPSP